MQPFQPPAVHEGFQSSHLPRHHAHNNVPPLQEHISPHIQAAITNHLATVNEHLGHQLVMGAMMPPGIPVLPAQYHHTHHVSTVTQPAFQQVIMQQEQLRAAAGRQGFPGLNATNTVASDANSHTQDQISQNPQVTSGNTHQFSPERERSRSGNWRITVNESIITVPTANMDDDNTNGVRTASLNSSGSLESVNGLPNSLSSPFAGVQGPGAHMQPALHTPAQFLEDQTRVRMQHLVQNIQRGLITMERAVASGIAPSEDQINQVRSQLNEILRHRNMLSGLVERGLSDRLLHVVRRATEIRGNSSSHPGAGMQVAMPTLNLMTPLVYLLSSPSGPHALLISPPDLYTANPARPRGPEYPRNLTVNFHEHPFNQAQHPNRMEDTRLQPAANAAAAQAQPGQQQRAEARDIARILLPLGGHLWLLIRLFGFVYFFTAGGGWRRAIVLGIGAILVFIAQTDIFRPFYQAVLEPVRRHLQGLIPLAANERGNAAAGAPGDAPRDGVNEVQGAAVGEPDVRQAAERLLWEREQRDLGAIRQHLQRFERAVAIFLASLLPGIGERHIAARDTAEALRLAEQVEGEENAATGDVIVAEQGAGEDGRAAAVANPETNESDRGDGRAEQSRQTQQGQPASVGI